MSSRGMKGRQSWIDVFVDWDGERLGHDNKLLVRSHINNLDTELHRIWDLGRNIILAWSPAGRGMNVLAVPHYRIADFIAQSKNIRDISFIFHIISERKQVTPRDMERTARAMESEVVWIDLPFEPGISVSEDTIEALVRRYSLSHGQDRAVALFDIVGFSLLDPLEQVTQLNSLAYSVNSAYSKLSEQSFNLKFARSTTGDGFYIWNRSNTLQANRDLYYFLLLILADNAIAQSKSTTRSVPTLRAAFHLGDHYEFYQSEGLSPTTFSYIVGDVTIELARMIDRAIPGQILMGDFDVPLHEDEDGTHMDTLRFVDTTLLNLDDLNGLVMSNDKIADIRCYLTGPSRDDGSFGITRFTIEDKHQMQHRVYNAKVNIYRTEKAPIFLGRQSSDLSDFQGQANENLDPGELIGSAG